MARGMEIIMVKKLLLLSIIFGFIAPTMLVSMEQPKTADTQGVTFKRPKMAKNKYKICAYINDEKVGSIKYQEDENKYWYISKLSVEPKYRKSNTSNKKIGFQLFAQCLKHICNTKPIKVHWLVTRIKNDSQDLSILTDIYTRMVHHLELGKYLTIEPYEMCSYMELQFNQNR